MAVAKKDTKVDGDTTNTVLIDETDLGRQVHGDSGTGQLDETTALDNAVRNAG